MPPTLPLLMGWSPSHGRWFSINFFNVGPSHGLLQCGSLPQPHSVSTGSRSDAMLSAWVAEFASLWLQLAHRLTAWTGQCWMASLWPEQCCSVRDKWICAHKSKGWPWIWTIWIVWRSICNSGLFSNWGRVLYSKYSSWAGCVYNTAFYCTNSAAADCGLLRIPYNNGLQFNGRISQETFAAMRDTSACETLLTGGCLGKLWSWVNLTLILILSFAFVSCSPSSPWRAASRTCSQWRGWTLSPCKWLGATPSSRTPRRLQCMVPSAFCYHISGGCRADNHCWSRMSSRNW